MTKTRKADRRLLAALAAALTLAAAPLDAQQKAEDFSRPVDRYAYAQGLKSAKIYDYAEKAFREFLRLHPDHELAASAWSNVIDCQRRRGDDAGMVESIREFRRRWPGHANLDVFTFWEGEAQLRQNRHAEAAACFEPLLKAKDAILAENSAFWLARCLFRGDQAAVERAYGLYRTLAARPLDPKAPLREVAVCELAREEHRRRRYDEAIRLYSALADYAQGRPALREEALYELGEIRFAQGEFQQARAAYDRFLAAFPKGRWAGEVRRRRAEAVYQLRQFDEALRLVLEWRSMNPGVEDTEMDYLHGRCLYMLGEYGTAWQHLEMVVRKEGAPADMRRTALVFGIHCLLEDSRKESWERGLEWCRRYREGFRDALNESRVEEFAGRLLENLGRHEEALAAYAATLRLLPETETARRNALRLRQADCLRKLSRWSESAAILRGLSDEPSLSEHRVRHLLWAAELELKANAGSPQAERDCRALLAIGGLPPAEQAVCHERLLSIYTERKDHARAQVEVEALLPFRQGDEREAYLFRDAWLLAEMKRPAEALARLDEALAQGAPKDRDARRETDMRLLALSLLLERQQAGDREASGRAVAQFRRLMALPSEMTAKALTPAILYQMAQLVAEDYARTHEPADRRLLEETYGRAVSGGLTDAASLFAAYRLAHLYMERADGRFSQAETLLRRLTAALQKILSQEPPDQELLRQLGQPEHLLREALSLQALCAFELGHDTDAMSAAEQVIARGANYSAAKRCLLIQARIFYERKPQLLERALEKLAQYQYVLSADRNPPEEEEEAMVLMVKVLRDLQRTDSALEAYRQLKVRYPERAAREPWAKEMDARLH